MTSYYQESESGRFTHNGKKYNLNAVLKLAHTKPTKHIALSKLTWILPYCSEEIDGAKRCRSCRKGPVSWHKERVDNADLSTPILVTLSDKRYVVLDGIHRLEKATTEGTVELPMKFIDEEELKDLVE